ncbi:hypothetical protein LTV02_16685 [Nocardia yamanashiensis]|uniref:hypothetical protein n=1 Tax=Nocardia yamanashiensis TaxID=209247 RepID=UPI000835A9F3|nr:hypothetical protein [Nocardia yamanashiensis]UGT44932.1 hypothetical protein LTV02_16685 [Nocardia yamanashiensis]
MRIKTIVGAGLLAAGIVAGSSAVANAAVYYGTYNTKAQCTSFGQAIVDLPNAKYHNWTCKMDWNYDWDLYLS